LRFIEKENGGGTNKKALAFYIRKTENGVRKTEFMKICFFVNLAFYSLKRRGILRSPYGSLRMTAFICAFSRIANFRTPHAFRFPHSVFRFPNKGDL